MNTPKKFLPLFFDQFTVSKIPLPDKEKTLADLVKEHLSNKSVDNIDSILKAISTLQDYLNFSLLQGEYYFEDSRISNMHNLLDSFDFPVVKLNGIIEKVVRNSEYLQNKTIRNILHKAPLDINIWLTMVEELKEEEIPEGELAVLKSFYNNILELKREGGIAIRRKDVEKKFESTKIKNYISIFQHLQSYTISKLKREDLEIAKYKYHEELRSLFSRLGKNENNIDADENKYFLFLINTRLCEIDGGYVCDEHTLFELVNIYQILQNNYRNKARTPLVVILSDKCDFLLIKLLHRINKKGTQNRRIQIVGNGTEELNIANLSSRMIRDSNIFYKFYQKTEKHYPLVDNSTYSSIPIDNLVELDLIETIHYNVKCIKNSYFSQTLVFFKSSREKQKHIRLLQQLIEKQISKFLSSETSLFDSFAYESTVFILENCVLKILIKSSLHQGSKSIEQCLDGYKTIKERFYTTLEKYSSKQESSIKKATV